MKILSLDLSTRSTGFAVYEDKELVSYGTITSVDKDYLVRAEEMANEVASILSVHNDIDYVIIEELKVLSNQKTLVMLGITQGEVIRACKGYGILLIPPTVWRKPYRLNGKRREAKKKAIDYCVNKLNLVVKNDDEAEAIILGKYCLENLDF